MTPEDVQRLLLAIEAWASRRSDVLGLAVVGSWAQGSARPDSDLDIMLLVKSPAAYRADSRWLSAIDWRQAGFTLVGFEDADYGNVWSRHVQLKPLAEVELTSAEMTWASLDLIDEGAASVVTKGCRVIFDKTGELQRFVQHLRRED